MDTDGITIELIGRTAAVHVPHGNPGHGRGEKLLVAGGDDGLTVLVTRDGRVIVVQPEGPLPGPERVREAVAMIEAGTRSLLEVAAAAELERV